MQFFRKILLWLIAIAILLIAIAIAHKVAVKPAVVPKPPPDSRPLVKVMYAHKGNYPTYIEAVAKVVAAQKIDLISQVSGQVVEVSKKFIPGGLLKKGELILKVDGIDYKLALERARSVLLQAKAGYEQAKGRSEQARAELKLYERTTGKRLKKQALALRKPDLDQAKANLASARAAFRKAQIDLKRTRLVAPFNAIVTGSSVNQGSLVGPGVQIGSIVNSDRYWLSVALPVSTLKYINFRSTPTAQIILKDGQTKEASFLKLANYLDDTTRFMGALFVLKSPLAELMGEQGRSSRKRGKSKLSSSSGVVYLGDYVNVRIKGSSLKNVYRLPIALLKVNDYNQNIIYVVEDGRLRFKKVDLLYQDHDYVYVKGLVDKDQVIASDLSVAVEGTKVKVTTN